MSIEVHTPAQGRPADEELTRRILEAAYALLRDQGYTALRIEHVARAAACGKAAVYRRYPDKAALVAAVLATRFEVGEVPATGAIRTDLLAHALQNQRNQDGLGFTDGRILFATLEPDVRALVGDAFLNARREQGHDLIARAVQRGELPIDVDPDVILESIAGLTLYRQSVRGIRIEEDRYLALIDALVTHPPRLPERLVGADPE